MATSSNTFSTPHSSPGQHWHHLVKELGMEKYLTGKLSLQEARALHIKPTKTITKHDLPWRVLEQIMLMNCHCREQDISKMAQAMQQTQKTGKAKFGQKSKQPITSSKVESLVHPMDMILVLFICGDFMLRQVLAQKLFMCRLAIPFIVPTVEDTIEMLIWPLRSIIMEWRKEGEEAMEEALVKCKINRVAVMRYGNTKVSKSKLINTLLSPSAHGTFFNKESPCGKEKRLISDGTVEISHFLPADSQQDQLNKPVLFFNLRGDACNHPIQHQLMMDLGTVLLIFLDIGALHNKSIQELLHESLNKKDHVIFVLTDSQGNDTTHIDQLQEMFGDLVGDAIDKIEVITTFEMEGGEVEGAEKNMTDVVQEVRVAVQKELEESSESTLETIAKLSIQCAVDENENHHCNKGKESASDILLAMEALDSSTRKQTLLPQQGGNLYKLGTLRRDLHRIPGNKENSECERIETQIKDIREGQLKALSENPFMDKVISTFQSPPATKLFAIRWLQLEIDAISRSNISRLQDEKNRKWKEQIAARGEKNAQLVGDLQSQISQLQNKIAGATLGLEHIFREMAQQYEAASELQQAARAEIDSLPDIASHHLLEGHPVELMDGDHGLVPIEWMKAVFQSLANHIGKNKKVFVLSIMGIQGSGKSTLLNTMFGLDFAVSAGRCTRGIYASLLPTADSSDLPFDFMLVLDSEGLRAQDLGERPEGTESNSQHMHDNELASLIIGLADLAFINIIKDNVTDTTDVLQVVVHSFIRMKLTDSPQKKQCMFMHQNVNEVNAHQKLAVERQKLYEQLDKKTKEASEAQDLPETITSFSRIISFDGEHDVVYFSDLWNGNPPMATVNEQYSNQAAETQQKVLIRMKNSPPCITISDFPKRVEDIWHGVLTEDFVFSYRNSMASKAYIDMERQTSQLTMQVEENLLQWVNTSCNNEMQSCATEADLESCYENVKISLKEMVDDLHSQSVSNLKDFLETHKSRAILIDWKSDKEHQLKQSVNTLQCEVQTKLQNMKKRNILKLRQQSAIHENEKEMKRKATALAERLRGNCSSDNELREEFDKLWKSWEDEFVSTTMQEPPSVLSVMKGIIWDAMSREGNGKHLKEQFELTPPEMKEYQEISTADINKHHIVGKGCESKGDFTVDATNRANAIIKRAMSEIEEICPQDIMFDPHHGKQVIDGILKDINQHNGSQAPFSFTPQLRAMLAVRIACYAAAKFESMNKRFEERHGIKKLLKDYKQRMFLLFKNAVKQTAAEIAAAEDFCAAIKSKLIEYVRRKLDERVLKELIQAIGTTKYD